MKITTLILTILPLKKEKIERNVFYEKEKRIDSG